MPKKVNEENPLIEDNGEFAPEIRNKLKMAKKLTQGYTDDQVYLCVEEFKGDIKVIIRGTYIDKKDEKRHFGKRGINLNLQEQMAADEIIKNLEVNTCLENLENEKAKNQQYKKLSKKINILKFNEFSDKYKEQIRVRRMQLNLSEANVNVIREIQEKQNDYMMNQNDKNVEQDIIMHLDEIYE